VEKLGYWLLSLNRWEKVLVLVGVLILLGWLNPFLGGLANTLCLAAVLGIAVFYALYRAWSKGHSRFPKVKLFYEAQDIERFQRLQQACQDLAESTLWLVESETKRTRVALKRGWPSQVSTNVETWLIDLRGTKLYFFPD